MPDVTKLLNQDHRKVEKLFERFDATQDHKIAMQICDELTVHAELEESVVYPRLAKVDRPLEQEAEKEHAEAKELIAKIRGMRPDDPGLSRTMTKLKQAIEHHVQEEESTAWPEMRESLGASQLNELGTKVEQQKKRLTGTRTTGSTSTRSSGRGRTTGGRTTLIDLTKEELYEKAKKANVEGRSSMTKDELIDALQRTS